MCYLTDFLVCINTAPQNNGCGAREFSVNFSNTFHEFSVKFGTFQRLYHKIAHFFLWIRLVPNCLSVACELFCTVILSKELVLLHHLYSEGFCLNRQHSSNQQARWQAAYRGLFSAYHSPDSQVRTLCSHNHNSDNRWAAVRLSLWWMLCVNVFLSLGHHVDQFTSLRRDGGWDICF